jgi:DNA polymerase
MTNYRNTDPETSVAAGESVDTTALEGAVLCAIEAAGERGLMSDEVGEALGMNHQTYSPRFAPLRNKGLIVGHGKRRAKSGRSQIVWVAGQSAPAAGHTLWIDLETYNETPITYGTHAYAATVEITLCAYAIDDGPVTVVDHLTPDLHALINDSRLNVCAHNSAFDRAMLRHAWGVDLPIERWRDTMVQALAHGLPGALGDLCDILKVEADQAKDKDGRALVMLFCKPRPINSSIRRATKETHPEEWARFVSYAGRDIEAMRAVAKILPEWNYKGEELALWHLDQTINDRGVAIDMDLVRGAVRAADIEKRALAKQANAMTDGAVNAATQRDEMLKFMLAEYGVDLPDLTKSTLERRLNDPDLPVGLRELIGVRLAATTTSVAKYKSLERGVSADGRLRGTLQFCGASRTGRWAGRLFQPQNISRGTLKPQEVETAVQAIKADCIDLVYDNPMSVLSSCLRGCIIAPPERKLVVADLSNIEGRVAAWLAGEAWKLQAFRDFDAGAGPDLYKMAYAKSFGIQPEQVNKDQRQVGKVQELALGYQGGVGAFITFANAYGIDLEAMGEQAYDVLPAGLLREADEFYDWMVAEKRPTHGLSRQAFVVCDTFKRAWRQAHPNITALWSQLEQAVREAIENPKKVFEVRDLRINRLGNWLRIKMPSGRMLCYPSPSIEAGKISYMGVNQYTRKWSRITTYGGKIFENLCQAVARDVMAANMPNIEAAGYDIVLSVHDELITETINKSSYNNLALAEMLAANPPWAQDLPLAAAGFETTRYKKD